MPIREAVIIPVGIYSLRNILRFGHIIQGILIFGPLPAFKRITRKLAAPSSLFS